MNVNQQHLKQAWDTTQISTREDWIEWMHRIGVEFMKESPSHALRACMSLVDIHPPLAKELFNAAFLSCWGELYDQYQVFRLVFNFKFLVLNHCTGGPCSGNRDSYHLDCSSFRTRPSTSKSGGIYGT